MTPEDLDPDGADEGLTPEDEEAVRRLLVAAADPLTMPDDVAGRLDQVLAGLQAERAGTADPAGSATDRPAPVTDLAERRNRRWPKVLVAAAAVAVVGVGLGTIGQNTGGGGDAAMSGDTAMDAQSEAGGESGSAPEAAAPGSDSDDGAARRDGTPQGAQGFSGDDVPTAALPRLRTGSATLDAQRIHDLSLGGTTPFSTKGDDTRRQADEVACQLPAVARGERLVAVRLDGERATLLFGAKEDGHRQAEVYSCDDGNSPELVTTVDSP